MNRTEARFVGSAASDRRNVLWSILDYCAAPLGMLIATPVFLRHLGIEQYGVLVLVTTIVGFSSVLNFGYGDTALKYVSHHANLGNLRQVTEIVRTIGVLGLGSGLLVGAFFVLAAPFAIVLFNLESLSYVRISFYLTAVIMPLRMMESIYVAILRGLYRYDLAGSVTVSAKIATIGVQIYLATVGYGLPALLVSTLGFALISNALLFASGCSRLGNITPGFFRESFDQVWQFSLWSWIQAIAGMVYSNVDRFVIVVVLGPSALGVYGVCIQLAQNIHYGLAAVAHSLFPRVSMLSAQGASQSSDHKKELRNLYLLVCRLVSVTAVVIGSLMAVFSYQILDIWVGSEFAEKGYFVLSLLSISFGWFAANSIVTYYTLNGLGLARLQAGVSATGSVIMTVASLILVPALGLIGAAVVRFPDTLFRLGVRVYLARSIIGDISNWMAFDFIRITLIVISSGLLLKWFLFNLVRSVNLLRDPLGIVSIAVFGLALLGVSYCIEVGLSKHRYSLISSLFRRISGEV